MCSERGLFYVFDSHSRNREGLSSANGTSVLGLLASLNVFCSYICSLVRFLNRNPDVVQFDLHYFAIRKDHKKIDKIDNAIEIYENLNGYRIVCVKKKEKESHQIHRENVSMLRS